MQESVKNILRNIGEDTEREGLLQTPLRMAKAMLFFTQGYEQSLEGTSCLPPLPSPSFLPSPSSSFPISLPHYVSHNIHIRIGEWSYFRRKPQRST